MVAAESEYDVAVSTRSWNIRACVWTIWKVTWLIDAFNFPISLEYGHCITVGYLRISLNLLFICTKYSHERLHHWFLSDTQLMCTAKLKSIQARYNICDWHFLPGWIFFNKTTDYFNGGFEQNSVHVWLRTTKYTVLCCCKFPPFSKRMLPRKIRNLGGPWKIDAPTRPPDHRTKSSPVLADLPHAPLQINRIGLHYTLHLNPMRNNGTMTLLLHQLDVSWCINRHELRYVVDS